MRCGLYTANFKRNLYKVQLHPRWASTQKSYRLETNFTVVGLCTSLLQMDFYGDIAVA